MFKDSLASLHDRSDAIRQASQRMAASSMNIEETNPPAARADGRKLANVLVPLFLSLLFVFLSIEFGLRKLYQLIPMDVCASDPLIGTYDCQPYFIYDKPVRIGYRYQPGFKLEGMWDPADPHLANAGDSTAPTGRSDAFWYEFHTDEMGFPNNQYKWGDKYDIVIAGDSFTVRTAPKTWIELLGQQTGADILTLGAPSWSTLNEAEAIKMYGLDKHPDWVLLMFFEGNDLINIAQYLERRDSGLNWKEFDLQGVPWSRRLLTPHLLHYLGEKLHPMPVEDADAAGYRYPISFSTEVGEQQTVLKDIHLLPLSAGYETLARSDEFAQMGDALIELSSLVQAQGARLLVVYIPSKEHMVWSRVWDPQDVNNILARTVTVNLSEGDHGTLQWQPDYLSYDTFTENHRAQMKLMEDFTTEHHIPFLNLSPAFWQEQVASGELYHYADPHWNQAGNQLAADVIADYLRAHQR